MKILFVWRQYHQSVGGVERTSIGLMNEMCRRGHDIYLLSWDYADARPYYAMDPTIDWFKLDCGDHKIKAGWNIRLKRMFKIRNYIKRVKPDIILAYMDGAFITTKLSILGLNIPIVEAERCSAARFKYLSSPLKTSFVFQTLRLAKRITVQLESYRKDYPRFLRDKIMSIPNVVYQASTLAAPIGESGKPKNLLSVGRLTYQKNYSALINAFAQISSDFPDWNLVIAGDGDEYEYLTRIISNLNLQNRITLLGAVKNVHELYAAAHLFCLPSRWEGFPNVLAEAMAHGLPAVGYADCLGVRDLIEHEKSGLLAEGAENVDSLAVAIRTLMSDEQLRVKMGTRAAASMRKYAPESIFDTWEKFFLETA